MQARCSRAQHETVGWRWQSMFEVLRLAADLQPARDVLASAMCGTYYESHVNERVVSHSYISVGFSTNGVP